MVLEKDATQLRVLVPSVHAVDGLCEFRRVLLIDATSVYPDELNVHLLGYLDEVPNFGPTWFANGQAVVRALEVLEGDLGTRLCICR